MRLIDADELKRHEYIGEICRWNYGPVVDATDIDKAPTIEAEPMVHAHWEPFQERKLDDAGEVCRTDKLIPRCTHCYHADPNFKANFRYCPHCGAHMDEEA